MVFRHRRCCFLLEPLSQSILFFALFLLYLLPFADVARLFKRQAVNGTIAAVPNGGSPTSAPASPSAAATTPKTNSIFSGLEFPPYFGRRGGGSPNFNFDFNPFSNTPNTNSNPNYRSFEIPTRSFPSFNRGSNNNNNNNNNNQNVPLLNASTSNQGNTVPNLSSFGNRNPNYPNYNEFSDPDFPGFGSSPVSFNNYPSFSNGLPESGRGGNRNFPQFDNFPANPNSGLSIFPTPRPRQSRRFPSAGLPTPPTATESSAPAASVCNPALDLPFGFDQISNDTIPENILQAINTSLTNNPQLAAVLDLLATANEPTPNIYPSTEYAEQSCPSVSYVATKFSRFLSSCWILGGKQQQFFYSKCQCHQCLAEAGSPQSPGSFCQPFTVPFTLLAYCENNSEVTVERVALPVTCRCRLNSPSVTQTAPLANTNTQAPSGVATTTVAGDVTEQTPAPISSVK